MNTGISWPLAPAWREVGDIIYFKVVSDGKTGERWINCLDGIGFEIPDSAKKVFRSSDFKPTSGVTTEVGLLKGNFFRRSRDRNLATIRDQAHKHGFEKPNVEVMGLILEAFTHRGIREMGLESVTVMHQPIQMLNWRQVLVPMLLYARLGGVPHGVGFLDVLEDEPDLSLFRNDGFAFALPQK
jgi:hypothetical protein